MENKLTYDEAFKELEAIKNEILNETISVDVLSEKVKRASELIAYCQEKLRATETEVNSIISNMKSEKQ